MALSREEDKKMYVLFVLVLFFPVSTMASDWQYFAQSTSNFRFYYDKDSDVVLSDGHHRLWYKEDRSDYMHNILVELSCAGEIRTLDEEIVKPTESREHTQFNKNWVYITPNSIAQGLEKAICKK